MGEAIKKTGSSLGHPPANIFYSSLFAPLALSHYYTINACVQTKISSLLKGSANYVVPWFDKKEKEKKNKNKEGDE